ncbi:MAG TPA: S8 family serine peptidase [Streptosporangiaceae bacterium]|jgi:subtilisin family serine protease
MRESAKDWFFESHPRDDAARPDAADTAQGQIILPASVLERHGALMLEPGRAAVVPGYPQPRSTVYRARTLLVPADLLDGPALDAINAVLARVGMRLIAPDAPLPRPRAGGRIAGTAAANAALGVLARLPRVAVLVPAAPRDGHAAQPVVIDAWVALQTLRAAATAARSPVRTFDDTRADGNDAAAPALDEQGVRRIGLEHLLVGASVTGAGAESGIAGVGFVSGHGLTAPGSAADSYVFTSGATRAPVAVVVDKPARRTAAECQARYGRRAVIAVLDTGVRAHPWLDVQPDPPDGYSMGVDGFVAVDQGMQNDLYALDYAARQAGDPLRQLISDPWDRPVTADPLIGELDTETGHGTFIAGIVRQVAPDAQVLAVRIMHSDGIVYEGDLTNALALVTGRIVAAEENDQAAMVDVVSLSLGYFGESPKDVAYGSGLWAILDVLLQLGVAVITAAGNFATRRRFWPAAFSEEPVAPGQVPLISVGALNPNRSKALFSDGGRWVSAWASGASVVSAFPTDVNGSLDPEVSVPARAAAPGLPAERAALDPDDYSGGFAVWSGTSFSAPLLAAHLLSFLFTVAANPALGPRLDEGGPEAAAARVIAALETMGWPG